ncbi:hypothetical protein [uncultured Methanobacterium sp.]|nr:hypothetical protein [uncultured Methanobacterium sp.]
MLYDLNLYTSYFKYTNDYDVANYNIYSRYTSKNHQLETGIHAGTDPM